MRKEGLFETIRSAFSPKKESPAKTEPAFPWHFSLEAISYIKGGRESEYKSTHRVLIVDEPHSDKEGQFNLYKFMGVLFRDNPTLVRRSIFLTEGYPA